jgi:DNA-binding CsgD family transcriptional regulator
MYSHSLSRPFPSHFFIGFSKRELQQTLEIVHYCYTSQTNEYTHRALTLAQTLLPCDKIVAAGGSLSPEGLDQDQANVINVSYPRPWLERYLTNRYIGIDPVALTWMKSQQTTVWNHTITKQNMVIEQEFMEEARGYGIANGIIGGTIDPRSGRISFVAFAGGAGKDNLRYKDVADYISSCLHFALTKNIPVPANEPAAAASLKSRETEVLLWIEEGKTTWEIARILDIRERTVRFHVEEIFKKLNTTTRAQAIAKAHKGGLLPSPLGRVSTGRESDSIPKRGLLPPLPSQPVT